MKQRIAIVVIGLLLGLAARMAMDYYQQFRSQHAVTPPAAAASPLTTKSPRAK